MVAESFERVHPVGMDVQPPVFEDGTNWGSLGSKGDEAASVLGSGEGVSPRETLYRGQEDARPSIP